MGCFVSAVLLHDGSMPHPPTHYRPSFVFSGGLRGLGGRREAQLDRLAPPHSPPLVARAPRAASRRASLPPTFSFSIHLLSSCPALPPPPKKIPACGSTAMVQHRHLMANAVALGIVFSCTDSVATLQARGGGYREGQGRGSRGEGGGREGNGGLGRIGHHGGRRLPLLCRPCSVLPAPAAAGAPRLLVLPGGAPLGRYGGPPKPPMHTVNPEP